MGLRPYFKVQYGPYGYCASSPRSVLNDIGRNMTPASIPRIFGLAVLVNTV